MQVRAVVSMIGLLQRVRQAHVEIAGQRVAEIGSGLLVLIGVQQRDGENEADRLLEVLLEREALQSTGIGEGVAIPHGKMVGLDRLVASFARSHEGCLDASPRGSCPSPQNCEGQQKKGPKIARGSRMRPATQGCAMQPWQP